MVKVSERPERRDGVYERYEVRTSPCGGVPTFDRERKRKLGARRGTSFEPFWAPTDTVTTAV